MIIYLDGPEKAGKSTLASEILEGFEEDRSQLVKHAGRDPQNGFGYLLPFVAGLDSPDIHVWDRGWSSEVVYGRMLKQDRLFSKDPFLCEWFYGRAMAGRGGKFIVLPNSIGKLAELRDESDLDVNPINEYSAWLNYANAWDYRIIVNDYTEESLATNAVKCRGSAFIKVHKMPSEDYIGPLNPKWLFVGDSHQTFSFEQRPFFNIDAAEYWRGFGAESVKRMGFASVEGFESIGTNLTSRIVTVGNKAAHFYPGFPNAPYVKGEPTAENILAFQLGVQGAWREYYV